MPQYKPALEQNSYVMDTQEDDEPVRSKVTSSESRIAREFREQREREEELERVRKMAGLQVVDKHEEEETPFLRSTGMDSSGTLPRRENMNTSQHYPSSKKQASTPVRENASAASPARPANIGILFQFPVLHLKCILKVVAKYCQIAEKA